MNATTSSKTRPATQGETKYSVHYIAADCAAFDAAQGLDYQEASRQVKELRAAGLNAWLTPEPTETAAQSQNLNTQYCAICGTAQWRHEGEPDAWHVRVKRSQHVFRAKPISSGLFLAAALMPGQPAPILSIDPEPKKCGRSDGNWSVHYVQASPFGDGTKQNTEAFFRKADALKWIAEKGAQIRR